MKRRTLLRVILGLTLLTSLPAGLRNATADPVASIDARAWRWEDLPGTGGLQVHCTRAVTVSWAQGVVTAGVLRLPMPAPGERIDMPGPGWGIAVRRSAR